MNLNKKHAQKNLVSNLGNINVERLSTNEINFFKNKKILITGVSGIIGINLLFFFNKLNVERKTSIHIDGTYNTSLFNFVKNYFKKNKKVNFIKIDLTKKKLIKIKNIT